MNLEPVDIKCPDCGGLAQFEEPFEFLVANETSLDDDRPTHQWGGWVVVERFPSQISWKAPSESGQYRRGGGGYPLLSNGLVQCSNCHINSKHKLQWPRDAYWQWHIRGEVLWAWNKQHALEILNFVRAKVRPDRTSYSLRYIPSHFLSAKVRDQVVQKIERSLKA